MVTPKEIKSRIRSILDTQKITNAMYMIASNKMRKAKKDLDQTRPYFDALHREMKQVFRNIGNAENKYFYPFNNTESPDETWGLLVITADKGLAGSYNQSVIKEAQRLLDEHPKAKVFIVGEYGRRFFSQNDIPFESSFQYSAQNPTMNRARKVCGILLEAFRSDELDKLFVVYTNLINSLTSEVVSLRLLPFHRAQSAQAKERPETEPEAPAPFECYPSVEAVAENVIKSWMIGFIYGALTESFCSEQSARMTAMNAANQNAEHILESLRVLYNRVRQASITQETTEVIAGVKAQKRKRQREASAF